MRPAAIIALVALCGAGVAAPAHAAQFGLYAGVSYAQTDRAATQTEFASEALAIYRSQGFEPSLSTATFDAKDATYGFAVGYRLLEHLALEAGYLDVGTVKYRDRSAGQFVDGDPDNLIQNIDSSTSGIAVSALGVLPITYRWEVFARGGVLLSSNSEEVYIANPVASARARATKSSFEILAGVGTTLSFLEIYNLRLEFVRVFDAGHEDTLGEADADLLTVGITVSF